MVIDINEFYEIRSLFAMNKDQREKKIFSKMIGLLQIKTTD
jgi:hypothetical protein